MRSTHLVRSRSGLSILALLVLLLAACVAPPAGSSPTSPSIQPTPTGRLLSTEIPAPAAESTPPATPTKQGQKETKAAPETGPGTAVPTAAPACTERFVPPVITGVQPQEVLPGNEITVIGSGGYTQDSCGGINESARTFTLYLDHQPAADLVCYVNHCEVKVRLEKTITPGAHCLSAEQAGCEFQFEINR